MNVKLKYYIFTFWTLLSISCSADKKEEVFVLDKAKASISELNQDTIKIKESFKQEDFPVNEYLTEKLKPIQVNFTRINSITHWTSIYSKELTGTNEGGEVKFYYLNKQLEKIVTRTFGETFQNLKEYYLLNGELSFVFEKTLKYNRPIYYDSTAMKENDDIEIFDFGKSKVVEVRSYFEGGKLIHQISNAESGPSDERNYQLHEQKRISREFESLIKGIK